MPLHRIVNELFYHKWLIINSLLLVLLLAAAVQRRWLHRWQRRDDGASLDGGQGTGTIHLLLLIHGVIDPLILPSSNLIRRAMLIKRRNLLLRRATRTLLVRRVRCEMLMQAGALVVRCGGATREHSCILLVIPAREDVPSAFGR